MIDGAGTNHFVTLMIFMNYLLEIIIRHLINHSNIDVEMGTFTPLVFGTNGGMGLSELFTNSRK